MSNRGPIYGVPLQPERLPIGRSGMFQAMPTQADLAQVCDVNERVAAAFEVLLDHYNQLHPRVWKLVRKGRHFLVVGEHEPYYETVYRIIRQSEIDAGTWTGEDEANFQEKTR